MLCVAIFFYQLLRIFSTLHYTVATAIIAVDKQKEIGGFESDFGAFVVACGSANTAYIISINWQILNI